LTFWQYSAYPAKFLARNFSSSLSLTAIAVKMGGKASNRQNEPKARGVKSSISNAPEYIGWRNTPYAPVEITFCTIPTSIVAEAKLFALKKRKTIRNPSTTKT
jgi:hypothetical protein